MTQENMAEAQQIMLTGRSGNSRKLLQRKAVERAMIAPLTDALEDSFPVPAPVAEQPAQVLQSGSSSPKGLTLTPALATPPLWSSEDEVSLQTLLARRKAAGYQRRGKDVVRQKLQPGALKPNEGSVSAVIVGIVAQAGTMTRGALIDAMATANFPHPKARPTDRGWCQGYVAGAIRSGFLTVAELSATLAGESSATPSERSAKLAERSANAGEV